MPADAYPATAETTPTPGRRKRRPVVARSRLPAVSLISRDPDLRLVVDRRVIRPRETVAGVQWFDVPARPVRVRIASRSCVPLTIGAGADLRRLGVPVRRILIRTANVEMTLDGEAPLLVDGFTDCPDHIRWTNGDAGLPRNLFGWITTAFEVGIELWNFPVSYPRRVRHALVIDATTPMIDADEDADDTTLIRQIRLMQTAGFAVTFVPQRDFAFVPGCTPALHAAGIATILQPRYRSIASLLQDHGSAFDLIYIHRAAVAERCMTALREHAPDVPVIVEGTDLKFPALQRDAALAGAREIDAAAEAIRARELAMLAGADCVLVADPSDGEAVQTVFPAIVCDHPPRVFASRAEVPDRSERRDFLLYGDYSHPAAVAAARWCVNEVLPALRARMRQPETRLHICGPGLTPALEAFADDDVLFGGEAADLGALLDRHVAFLAPPRTDLGSGTPRAIPLVDPGLDPVAERAIAAALASGLPVIAAPDAAALFSLDRDHGLIADTAEAFADAVTRLEDDHDEWTRLSAAVRGHVDRAFTVEQARRWFAGLLAGMGRADLLEPE